MVNQKNGRRLHRNCNANSSANDSDLCGVHIKAKRVECISEHATCCLSGIIYDTEEHQARFSATFGVSAFEQASGRCFAPLNL